MVRGVKLARDIRSLRWELLEKCRREDAVAASVSCKANFASTP